MVENGARCSDKNVKILLNLRYHNGSVDLNHKGTKVDEKTSVSNTIHVGYIRSIYRNSYVV